MAESNGSLPPGGWLIMSAGWLPVHRDQLQAQCLVMSMGSLYPFFLLSIPVSGCQRREDYLRLTQRQGPSQEPHVQSSSVELWQVVPQAMSFSSPWLLPTLISAHPSERDHINNWLVGWLYQPNLDYMTPWLSSLWLEGQWSLVRSPHYRSVGRHLGM